MGTIPIGMLLSHILIALLCHPMYQRCSLQLCMAMPARPLPLTWPSQSSATFEVYLFAYIILILAHSSVFAHPESAACRASLCSLGEKIAIAWALPTFCRRIKCLDGAIIQSNLAIRLGRSTGKAALTPIAKTYMPQCQLSAPWLCPMVFDGAAAERI